LRSVGWFGRPGALRDRATPEAVTERPGSSSDPGRSHLSAYSLAAPVAAGAAPSAAGSETEG
jgi:hypothetical protein